MSVSTRLQRASRWGAYGVAVLILALAPGQLAMPCGGCGTLLGFAGGLFLLGGALCLMSPRTVRHRFRPMAFAFGALLAHTVFLHR